jgi:outer membrane immunogenic protein
VRIFVLGKCRRSSRKAPAIAPPYSWTGIYVGANVGYGWSKLRPGTISFFDPGVFGTIDGIDYSLKGVIGGGQAGFNYQFDNILLGIEGDFSGTGIDGSVTDSVHLYTATSKINWLATARGRAGVVMMERALIYATGGLAVADIKTTLDDVYPAGIITTTSSATYVGWTVGGGVEFALAPHWTVKAEYLYVDLGSKEYNFYERSGGWQRITGTAAVTASITRVGANFKF